MHLRNFFTFPSFLSRHRGGGSGTSILLASISYILIASEILAQDVPQGFISSGRELPEAILVPIIFEGATLAHAGWILSYRNGLRGSSTPDREIETRSVIFRTLDGRNGEGRVSWEIIRTPNGPCEKRGEKPCPDTIRVISLPDGFLAFPEKLRVDEGMSARIYIVRNLIG